VRGRLATAGAVLRGLRARGLLSAVTLVMMVLAVAGTVVGPVLQQAATTSYTLTRVDDAPDPLTALTWTVSPGRQRDLDRLVADAVAATGQAAPAVFGDPEVTWFAGPFLRTGDGAQFTYLARDDACETLEIEGRCPTAPGEVLVNEDDLGASAVGDAVRLPALGRAEIVGVYRTPATPDDWLFTARLTSRPAGVTSAYQPAPYVVDPAVLAGLPPRSWAPTVDRRLEVPADLDDATFDRLAAEAQRLATLELPLPRGATATGSAATNTLGAVLVDVRAQREAAASAVAPAVVSLVLVALAIILRLQSAAAALRGPELALAALRGVGRRRAWALGLAEPWLLVLLSLPLGLLAGWGAATALARAWLRPGTPLVLPGGSLVAAAAVVVAIALVTALAVGQGMRETLAARLAGVRRPARGARTGLLVEVVVVALAAVLPLTRLGADERGLGLADLLLPVVTAVAAGLLVTRLVAVAAGWWTRRGPERPLSVFVAARALARRAQGTLVILPVAAAIAVAVFAAGVDGVAAQWRGSVAATEAPAAEVWDSPLGPDQTLQLTRRLDPDGQWLMTAAAVSVPEVGPIVLVDTPRLARVGTWPAAWLDGATAADVADLLAPPAPLVRLTGGEVALTADAPAAGVTVTLDVNTAEGRPQTLTLGPFAAGTSTRTLTSEYCEAGCDVLGLAVDGPDGAEVSLAALTGDGEPVVPALAAGGWSDPDGIPLPVDGDTLVTTAGQDAVPALALAALPVLEGRTAGDTLTRTEDGDPVLDLDPSGTADPLPVEVRGTAESLPVVGPAGLMLDLTTFSTRYQAAPALVESLVLVRDGAPADVRQGLVDSEATLRADAATTRRVLDDSAYAQALRLYLVVGAALLLMALGGLLVSTAVQLAARRRDAASLRVVGVPPRTLVAASLWESLVALGAAVVAGTAAGALAQAVLLSSLSLGVVDDAATPRVLPDLDVTRLLLIAGGVAAVLLLVSLATSVTTVRRARGATLREDVG
jgi:putative ABC transport system permease protein